MWPRKKKKRAVASRKGKIKRKEETAFVKKTPSWIQKRSIGNRHNRARRDFNGKRKPKAGKKENEFGTRQQVEKKRQSKAGRKPNGVTREKKKRVEEFEIGKNRLPRRRNRLRKRRAKQEKGIPRKKPRRKGCGKQQRDEDGAS